MSDWTDDASEVEQRDREIALAKIVRYAGESAQSCEECGDDISSARQLAVPGCQLCTECASYAEARR